MGTERGVSQSTAACRSQGEPGKASPRTDDPCPAGQYEMPRWAARDQAAGTGDGAPLEKTAGAPYCPGWRGLQVGCEPLQQLQHGHRAPCWSVPGEVAIPLDSACGDSAPVQEPCPATEQHVHLSLLPASFPGVRASAERGCALCQTWGPSIRLLHL